jgi:putative transport protein
MLMSFNYAEWLMDPFVLMFITVVTGLILGKVKFGKFNFGISGTLFTGLIIGWFIYRFAGEISLDEKSYKSAQKLITLGVIDNGFFTMFLVLFVVAVGLLAAKDLDIVIKKYGAKFILLGLLITFVGAGSTYGMTLLLEDANPYEVSGVYTGALTSSPGLAAAIETAHVQATKRVEVYDSLDNNEKAEILSILDKDLNPSTVTTLTEDQEKQFVKNAEAGVGTGYAITYAFGVIIVIFAVTFFPMIFRIDLEAEKKAFSREMTEARASSTRKEIKEVDFDLLGFIIACLFGYTIGLIVIKLSE